MSSVEIKYANRNEIERAVADYVSALRGAHPEVERILWFGSWVTGVPTPGSDVDLCLVIESSTRKRRDRAPDYLPVGFPVGVDLLVYTRVEFDRLRDESPAWYATITSGRELFGSVTSP